MSSSKISPTSADAAGTPLSVIPECRPSIEVQVAPEGWLQAPALYPQLVVRIYSAVYSKVPIELKSSEPAKATIASSRALLCHPGVDSEKRTLDPAARKFLSDAVLAAVRRTGFRMCLVYGEQEAIFIEKDGSMNPSNEPPSGGLRANLNHTEPLSNLSADISQCGAQQDDQL